jgi:hypothetical protein
LDSWLKVTHPVQATFLGLIQVFVSILPHPAPDTPFEAVVATSVDEERAAARLFVYRPPQRRELALAWPTIATVERSAVQRLPLALLTGG